MENCFTRVKSISENSMFWCVRDIALILMIGLGIVHRIQCFRTRLSCTLAEGAPSIETHEMSTRTYMGHVSHIGSARVLFVVYCDVLALLRFSTCLAEHFC